MKKKKERKTHQTNRMLEYGIVEKYNKETHGPLCKTRYDKYLSNKYLSFENKEKEESAKDFFLVWQDSAETITLKNVYQFNNYYFAKDRSDIIVKIQKLWKSYVQRKYNVTYLRNRQIDFFYKNKNFKKKILF